MLKKWKNSLTGTTATVTVFENLTLFFSPFSFFMNGVCCAVAQRIDDEILKYCRDVPGGFGGGEATNVSLVIFFLIE